MFFERAAAAFASAVLITSAAAAADVASPQNIQLELRPRICTLSAQDEQCDTEIHAQWRAPRDESLCLVIVGHPDIKRCWENYNQGTYSVRLVFSENLLVELRDLQLQKVLVSEAVTVIKEALRLRRKRRQPWNILY